MKKIFTITVLLLSAQLSFGQNLQGGFEGWRTYSSGSSSQLQAPNGWYGIDSLVFYLATAFPFVNAERMLFQSNTAHGGTLGARLISRDLGVVAGIVPGVLTNAVPGIDMSNLDPSDPAASLTYTGGTPVPGRVSYISAWVKYEPVGADTGEVIVLAVMNNASTGNQDSIVGEGHLDLSMPHSAYTQIFVPVNYNNSTDIPNKVVIAFISGAAGVMDDSSTLYVDDVNYVTVGVDDPLAAPVVSLYPNPARELVHISAAGAGSFTWQAFNLQGQVVAEKQFTGAASADVRALPSGLYTYRVADNKGVTVQRGRFEVLR